LKPNSEISCIEPEGYRNRFITGIQKIFKICEEPYKGGNMEYEGAEILLIDSNE